MQKKRNESEAGSFFREVMMFHVHKAGDRRYPSCPICHKPVLFCPSCHGSMLFQKSERLPDFVVSPIFMYVEGKSASSGTFNMFSSFSDIQEITLGENAFSYLWLDIGDGRADVGKRMVFLIPWSGFTGTRDRVLKETGIKSILFTKTPRSRAAVAKDVFGVYALKWQKGGWVIDPGHPFWVDYKLQLEVELSRLQELMYG
jgi:hypothetical protein